MYTRCLGRAERHGKASGTDAASSSSLVPSCCVESRCADLAVLGFGIKYFKDVGVDGSSFGGVLIVDGVRRVVSVPGSDAAASLLLKELEVASLLPSS